jgi:hypothetical protein
MQTSIDVIYSSPSLINIEFMWRGLETGERRALVSLSIRFMPSHIHYIFTVNTPILYLSCNKICKILFLPLDKYDLSWTTSVHWINVVVQKLFTGQI